MANRHFGKAADVWKHLPLLEVLSIERPTHYWDSHAGNSTLAQMLAATARPANVLAHVDPYDPRATISSGPSAIDLASLLIEAGAGLVYWYGYDRPENRGWALHELAQGTNQPLWGGDMLVTGADGETAADGDLGRATTPGTGFGIVCANVSPRSIEVCETLGAELSAFYDGAPLPDGTAGCLDFASSVVAS